MEAPLESFSPFDGARVGAVAAVEPGEVASVVKDAARVQPFWAQLPLAERAAYMRRAAQAVLDELDELSSLIAREQGKPRNEALTMELLPAIEALRWLDDAGPRILADERVPLPLLLRRKSARFAFEPLGVVGVIAPWNYPWSIPFTEAAMALMAGNGVVIKPAPLTPLTGMRIQEVFERAGLPEGLVRVVQGGADVGEALVASGAAKIFFTGSLEVGRRVGDECAHRMKGSVLELGGKDAMIVCADANLPNAVGGCLWGGFANAGQTCSGIERVYVVREVAERFIAGVVEGARRLRLGDPLAWDTEIGPMVSTGQLERVTALVDDAVAGGAELRCGGADAALLSSRRAHRRATGHAGDARGDVRAGGADRDRGGRGRGDRAGQRLRVRPGRLGLDRRPGQGGAHGPPDRDRHGLGQRPHVHPRRGLVLLGRRQELGSRPLPLQVRAVRVRERQAR